MTPLGVFLAVIWFGSTGHGVYRTFTAYTDRIGWALSVDTFTSALLAVFFVWLHNYVGKFQ